MMSFIICISTKLLFKRSKCRWLGHVCRTLRETSGKQEKESKRIVLKSVNSCLVFLVHQYKNLYNLNYYMLQKYRYRVLLKCLLLATFNFISPITFYEQFFNFFPKNLQEILHKKHSKCTSLHHPHRTSNPTITFYTYNITASRCICNKKIGSTDDIIHFYVNFYDN